MIIMIMVKPRYVSEERTLDIKAYCQLLVQSFELVFNKYLKLSNNKKLLIEKKSVYMSLSVDFSCAFSKLIICNLDTLFFTWDCRVIIIFFIFFITAFNVENYSTDKQWQKKQIKEKK